MKYLKLDLISNLKKLLHTSKTIMYAEDLDKIVWKDLPETGETFILEYDTDTEEFSTTDAIMTIESNPKAMKWLYSIGLISNLNILTKEEAETITALPENVSFSESDITDFTEFKYFSNFEPVEELFANTKIQKISLPSSFITIPQLCFTNSAIKDVTFSLYTTTLDELAFYDCDELETLIFPSSIVNFHEYAIVLCNKLKTVIFKCVQCNTFPTFILCKALNSITFPNVVLSCPDAVFNLCESLVDVDFSKLPVLSLSYIYAKKVISNTVKTIENAPNLEYVYTNAETFSINGTPHIVDTIVLGKNCTSATLTLPVKNLIIESEHLNSLTIPQIYYLNSITFTDTVKHICKILANGTNTTILHLELPNTVETLGTSCFSAFKGVTTINLSTSLETLPLLGLANLLSIDVPSNIKTLVGFLDSPKLKTVTLHEGLETINSGAFTNTLVETLIIPDSASISNNYLGATKLKTLHLGANVKTVLSLLLKPSLSTLLQLTFSEGVETISSGAFYGNFTELSFPSTITTIENRAFYGVPTTFDNLVIPSTVASIGTLCVKANTLTLGGQCTTLTLPILTNSTIKNLILAEGIETLEADSIPSSVETLVLPNSLTTIEANAFRPNTNITSITVGNLLESIPKLLYVEKIIFKEGRSEILDNFCNGWYSLNSVTYASTITTIGEKAFYGCNKLLDLDLPESFTTIKTKAYALTSATLTSKLNIKAYVTECAEDAFENRIVTPSTYINRADLDGAPWGAILCLELGEFIISADGETVLRYTGNDENVTVPEGIKYLDSLFIVNLKAKNITLPTTLVKFDGAGSKTLETLTIPKNTNFISAYNNTNLRILDASQATTTSFGVTNDTCLADIKFPKNISNLTVGGAFYNCNNLEALELPDSILTIGSSILVGVNNLKFVKFPEGDVNIDSSALPQSITTVVNGKYRSGSLNFPKLMYLNPNETTITQSDATYHTALEYLFNSKQITSLLGGSLYNTKLKLYIAGENCTLASGMITSPELVYLNLEQANNTNGSFYGDYSSVKKIVLPNTLITLPQGLLGSITKAKSMGPTEDNNDYDIEYSSNLTTILIASMPSTIEYLKCAPTVTLAEYASIAGKLKYFEYYGNNFSYTTTLLNILKLILKGNVTNVPGGLCLNAPLRYVELGDNISNIGMAAFSNTLIKEVSFPNNTLVSCNAFDNCLLLKRINSDVDGYCYYTTNTSGSMYSYAFCNLPLIHTVVFDSALAYSQSAFLKLDLDLFLYKLALPDTDLAIYSNIKVLHFDYTNTTVPNLYNGNANAKVSKIIFPNGLLLVPIIDTSLKVESVEIPDTVTSFSNGLNLPYVTNLSIPEGVAAIPSTMFSNGVISELTLPSSLKTIEQNAFAGSNIYDINLENIKTLDYGSFLNLTNPLGFKLADLSSIETINNFVFREVYVHKLILGGSPSISTQAFENMYILKENFINESTLDAEANNYWGAVILDECTEYGLAIKNNKIVKILDKELECIVIPDNITGISLNVLIPESIKQVIYKGITYNYLSDLLKAFADNDVECYVNKWPGMLPCRPAEYFNLTSSGDTTLSLSGSTYIDIYYTTDPTKNLNEWNVWNTASGLALTSGVKYYFYNTTCLSSSSVIRSFSINNTSTVQAHGYILTLGGFNDASSYSYCKLFYQASWLTTMPDFLPVYVGQHAYNEMFRQCSSLTTVTSLPALIATNYCYDYMFYCCSSIVLAPKINLKKIPYGGCSTMFFGCSAMLYTPELNCVEIGALGCLDMFSNTRLVTSPKLNLLQSVGMYGCYYMFKNCTYMTTGPETLNVELNYGSFYSMFYNCTQLTKAPSLPMVELADYCYAYMFYNCRALINAPELPATTLSPNCYYYMFANCVSLTEAPKLPAKVAPLSCYASMFLWCVKLTSMPELSATTLASSCYEYMFYACTSLTIVHDLNATYVPYRAYGNMFQSCTSLITAPRINATDVSNYSCQDMFSNCTKLEEAPELLAETLTDYCYLNMFNYCTSLRYVKICAKSKTSYSTLGWLNNAAPAGIIEKYTDLVLDTNSSSGVPSGWTTLDIETT